MTGPRRALAAAVLAAWLAAPVPAQQFDSFGDGGGFGDAIDLETFDFGDPPEDFDPENLDLPDLSDGADATEDDGISLDITTRDGDEDDAIITFPGTRTPVTSVLQPETVQAGRATLRALDKTLGRPTDVDLAVEETVIFGRIAIRLLECRYPAGDPSSDAYAHLEIYDLEGNSLFAGWMVASSPALSALEHPRYDVWVLSCGQG